MRTRMCLSIPAKVLEVRGNRAVVESRGWRREADTTLVAPAVGDWVLVQTGLIVQVLTEEEALETLRAWEEAEAPGGA